MSSWSLSDPCWTSVWRFLLILVISIRALIAFSIRAALIDRLHTVIWTKLQSLASLCLWVQALLLHAGRASTRRPTWPSSEGDLIWKESSHTGLARIGAARDWVFKLRTAVLRQQVSIRFKIIVWEIWNSTFLVLFVCMLANSVVVVGLLSGLKFTWSHLPHRSISSLPSFAQLATLRPCGCKCRCLFSGGEYPALGLFSRLLEGLSTHRLS